MPDPITQEGRLLSIRTPLEYDTLLIDRFTGLEAISQLFRFEIKLLADAMLNRDRDVHAKDLVGGEATIAVALPDGSARYISGVIRRFTKGFRDGRYVFYSAELVPWLSMLALTSDCRIFQDKTVPDILTAVFEELGFGGKFRSTLTRTYTSWSYCVQYRETDLNFVSRLMEAEGIYYYFEHEDKKHTLVLADAKGTAPTAPVHPVARFMPSVGWGERENVIHSFETCQQMVSTKAALRDFHFITPRQNLQVDLDSVVEQPGATDLATYDFPGGYAVKFNADGSGVRSEGEKLLRAYLEAGEADYQVSTGASACCGFTPGYKMKVLSDRWEGIEGNYLITAVEHSGMQAPTYASVAEMPPIQYQNRFTTIPADTPFRAPRVTPKPVIQGPQTAMVVGPAGEEIYVDKYGRVKVQFHWDRQGTFNEKSSCWVRVAQPWTGSGWGAMFIPRIGHEVVVQFLEGDPDQPLITGGVYNGMKMPPYELPKFQTLSYIKTDSSKGSQGHHQLRFEDKKGKEQVFIHSQRRMDVRVLGSLFETNHANRHAVIGWSGGTESGGDFNILVGGDVNQHIKKGLYEGIDDKLNLTVKADVVQDLQAKLSIKVTADCQVNARQITLEGLQKITLKVGSSSVVLALSGITIDGPMVKINSGGSATGCSNVDIEDPLDASPSDTGEPGYLDRPGTGGGPAGRRRRTLNMAHGPNVTREANGDYRIGRHTVVDGSNQAFADATLNDLATIGNTPRGQQLFSDIDGGDHDVRITERPVNPADPQNADAQAGDGSWDALREATPAGQPVYDGMGHPGMNPDGTQMTGTGNGTDSTVHYDPTVWPSPEGTPSDVILEHEMTHASHQTNGTYDGTPHGQCFDTNEEFNTIGPENDYRDQVGVHRRTNHKDL